MSKEAATADLQAAAYWRSVARADRAEASVAGINVRGLTNGARSEEKEPVKTQRHSRGLSSG
jgi:hypothetical protein